MGVVITNNAVSKLASSIAKASTVIAVTAGEGVKFPNPGAGQWFPVTIIKATGEFEIVRCTARAGDVLTVVRAQEGTASLDFSVGDRVEHRVTAAAFNEFVQPGDGRLKQGAFRDVGNEPGKLLESGGDINVRNGSFAGPVICTYSDTFRIARTKYGSFWRSDDTNLYLLLTAMNDPLGAWNALRPLTVNLSTGKCDISGYSAGMGDAAASEWMRRTADQTNTGNNTWQGYNTYKQTIFLTNGTSDSPEVTWQVPGSKVAVDLVGTTFRAFFNDGAAFPFEFNISTGQAKFFGSDGWTDATAPGKLGAKAVGEIGTYALMRVFQTVNPGQEVDAGILYYSNGQGHTTTPRPAGTWRCMGFANGGYDEDHCTVFLRVR